MEGELNEMVLELQNDETIRLASLNAELAYEFQEELNLRAIAGQLRCLESILMNQGIFIREFLDKMDDSKV